MASISLPWIEKSPETLGGYRRRAIGLLLALGIAHLAIGVIGWALLEPMNADRLSDGKVPWVLLLCIGAMAAGFAFVLGAFAVATYRTIGRILLAPWVAFTLFFGVGVVGACLLVWLHAWAFEVTQPGAAAETHRQWWLPGVDYFHRVADLNRILVEREGIRLPLLAYALWPLQFALVRDLVAVGGIIGFISLIPLFGIWWERKVAGRIQSRMGPMRVGGWHGWLQSPADGLKLIFKEDYIPPEGDPFLFKLAPYLTFVPPICAFIALPFAAAWVFRDLDVALIFILAMLGIEVVGVILAGWASNNKWSVYGAMREACQMVSYEIPMGMALLIPVMTVGSLQLTAIADAQGGWFTNWLVFANPWCFIAFFIYYTAALASCKRAPFDLPESESELVAGFLTEYSGFRWSLFFFGEYAAMYLVSGVAAILFLGGWKTGLPPELAGTMISALGAENNAIGTFLRGLLAEGPIIFVLKATALFFVQIWIRWTLPRIRIDQVLYACIQVLLPLTMIVLLANTLWILGIEHLKWTWLIWLNEALHWVLVLIGLATLAACIAIALYGFRNNRRLVGRLAVDPLPGS